MSFSQGEKMHCISNYIFLNISEREALDNVPMLNYNIKEDRFRGPTELVRG